MTDSGSVSSAAAPRVVIDHHAFPQIIDLIFEFCSTPAHRVFAQTSRAFLERADTVGDCGTYWVDVAAGKCFLTRRMGLLGIDRKRNRVEFAFPPREHTKPWWAGMASPLRVTHIRFSETLDYKSENDESIHSEWDQDYQMYLVPGRPLRLTASVSREDECQLPGMIDYTMVRNGESLGSTHEKNIFFIDDQAAWTCTHRDVPTTYSPDTARSRLRKNVFVINHLPVRMEYGLSGWMVPETPKHRRDVVFIFPDAGATDTVFTLETKNFYDVVHFHHGVQSIKNCTAIFVNLSSENQEYIRSLLVTVYRDSVSCPGGATFIGHECEPIPEGQGRMCLPCGREHRFINDKFEFKCPNCPGNDHRSDDPFWGTPDCTKGCGFSGTPVPNLISYEFEEFLETNLHFLTIDEYRATLKPGEWEEETVRFPDDDLLSSESASKLALEDWLRDVKLSL